MPKPGADLTTNTPSLYDIYATWTNKAQIYFFWIFKVGHLGRKLVAT
jgi:hypothetical protein